MLNRVELKDISKAGGNGAYYVSLYLDVNPATNPKGDYLIWFKNEMKRTAGSLDKSVLKAVEKDLLAMEAYIQGNKREFKKGLAIISSRENDFLRTYHLSVPLRNELVVNRSPYINPLMDVLERYRRYAVLIVDKESARIFVVHLGEITEYGELHTDDVPGKHKKGGWYALSQNHYERHIDYHVGLHLKDVAGRFERFLMGEEIDRLVFGGSEDAIIRSRELLPGTISEKIIGTFSAGMFENNAGILSKVEPVLSAYERNLEEETLTELIQKAMKQERAAVGLENVLRAVQEGRIMKLVLERDFRSDGLRCTGCGALTTRKIEECLYCGGALETVSHIVDFAVQKAVEQGAEVEVVSGTGDFRRAGRIGAFLRF
jgi:peptide chain release factor subunit 1